MKTNQQSDVSFKNSQRIHFGLHTHNLEASIAFYREIFNTEPAKTKEDYVKFELDDPSINLGIGLVDTSVPIAASATHFGIQVKSSETVDAFSRRFQELGYSVKVEEQSTCCYAQQDKVWISDPDGRKWEIFVVTDYNSKTKMDPETKCCEPTASCC